MGTVSVYAYSYFYKMQIENNKKVLLDVCCVLYCIFRIGYTDLIFNQCVNIHSLAILLISVTVAILLKDIFRY